jgi:hypothetical protein
VDLIGNPSFFDFLPGNGRYVDLDGSTGDAGKMTSIALSLAGGVLHKLSFDLAGSQRGDTNTVAYGIDLDSNGTFYFSTTSFTRIVFDHNFTLNAVPLPASIWLFGSALAGLGAIRRKPVHPMAA